MSNQEWLFAALFGVLFLLTCGVIPWLPKSWNCVVEEKEEGDEERS